MNRQSKKPKNKTQQQDKSTLNQTHLKKFHINERRRASGDSPESFIPNFYDPFEIKRRRRTSRDQSKLLEEAYIDNPKPDGKTRRKLAETLSMSPRSVQVWFQNKRAKEKQQKDQEFNCSVSMVHSHSQSSTPSLHSDLVPSYDQAAVFKDPLISIMPSHIESPAQSQVLLGAPPLLDHQIFDQIRIVERSNNNYNPFFCNTYNTGTNQNNVQALPYNAWMEYSHQCVPQVNSDTNSHQLVDDWVNTVSFIHHPEDFSLDTNTRHHGTMVTQHDRVA